MPTVQERLDRRTILALAAMAISVLVVANAFTAMSVALTTIERDLNADLSRVQWVINAYAVVFGVLIVTGGRLADMLGRRRVFVLGAGVFAGFSVLGGLAPNAVWLIACRAVMGVGGAMMWPAIVGMTYAVLPEAKAGLAGRLILGAAGGEIDTFETEKRFLRRDGSVLWVSANLTFLRDEQGRPIAWLGQFQDITERRRHEERLRRLTGRAD